MGRPCAMFVPAEDFVVSYGASDLTTMRKSQRMLMKKTSNEIQKLQGLQGFIHKDIDLIPVQSLTLATSKKNTIGT